MKLYLEDCDHNAAIGDEKLRFCNHVYAHGDLESMAGFDLVNHLKDEPFSYQRRIEDVTAVLPDGKEVQAKLYCSGTLGLIVLPDDKDGIRDAESKFHRCVESV